MRHLLQLAWASKNAKSGIARCYALGLALDRLHDACITCSRAQGEWVIIQHLFSGNLTHIYKIVMYLFFIH